MNTAEKMLAALDAGNMDEYARLSERLRKEQRAEADKPPLPLPNRKKRKYRKMSKAQKRAVAETCFKRTGPAKFVSGGLPGLGKRR